MIISYFIPEDGDTPNHPNVFNYDTNSNQITLGVLKRIFPLPGEYHFRCRKSIGSRTVWLDIVDDNDVLPLEDGRVFAKVSRIENAIYTPAPAANVSPREKDFFVQTQQAQPPSLSQSQSNSSQGRNRLLSFDDGDAPQPQSNHPSAVQDQIPSVPAATGPERRKSEKLISFDQFEETPTNNASPFDNDFVGLSTAPTPTNTSGMSQSNSNNVDVFGMAGVNPMTQGFGGSINAGPMRPNSGQGGMYNNRQPMSGSNSGGFDAFSNLNSSPMYSQQNRNGRK